MVQSEQCVIHRLVASGPSGGRETQADMEETDREGLQ